jgi:hypothetical protein
VSRKSGQGYEAIVEFQGRYKQPRVNPERGVIYVQDRDGRGRIYSLFMASIQHAGVVRRAKFTVSKYGFANAKGMAQAARKRWMEELVGGALAKEQQ